MFCPLRSRTSFALRQLGRNYQTRTAKELSFEVSKLRPLHDRSELAEKTREFDMPPEVVSVVREMQHFVKIRDAAGALDLLQRTDVKHVAVYNVAINACAKGFDSESAWRIWREMSEKNTISYSSMLSALGTARDCRGAEQVWQQMQQQGLQPNIIHYTSMITAYGIARQVDRALDTFNDMQAAELKPDSFAYLAAMAACGRIGDYAKTREIFVEMLRDEIKPTQKHLNILLGSCAKGRYVDIAEAIFNMFPAYGLQPRTQDYTVLLGVCRGDVERCRRFVEESKSKGLQPDIFLLQEIIEAEVEAGNLSIASELLKEAALIQPRLTPMLRRTQAEHRLAG